MTTTGHYIYDSQGHGLFKKSKKRQGALLVDTNSCSKAIFYQQLVKKKQLSRMDFPSSAFWPPYMQLIHPSFYEAPNFPSFPSSISLYQNFENEQFYPGFLPQQFPQPYYEQMDFNQFSPNVSRNDHQLVTPPVKIEETSKKIRILKKKPKSNENNRILRECMEPTKYDRNIQSNALKIFLKYLRNISKFQYSLVNKIIQKNHFSYSPEQFTQDLDKAISPTLNYIRPIQIQKICESRKNQTFSLIFRVCLKNFFSKEIHMISTKPVRTNRFVRRQQIKAGRRLIDSLFNC